MHEIVLTPCSSRAILETLMVANRSHISVIAVFSRAHLVSYVRPMNQLRDFTSSLYPLHINITLSYKRFSDQTLCAGITLLVAQLVEALRYNLEGRGFDSRWCHWNFSLT
jgi:hypothetical protein